jgi:hypothetical protein
LASIDLIELCKEAKVERCRATRDLRSCGRYVHHVLNSCGHASLCEECSQRCDICPICRNPIPKSGTKLRHRLYYECMEAGLISKRCDERFQEIEDGEKQLTADVQRLYSLFDVALENNLVSLICHCILSVSLIFWHNFLKYNTHSLVREVMLENFVFVLLLYSETESNSVCFYSPFPMFCIGSVVLYCHLLSLLCIFLTRNFTDITDVCMDETAVSSDPIIAFLLDEVVVKDWCKRTFKDIMTELQGICIL